MNAHNEQQWPEYLMLRDTGLYDDAGGLGQHIFTTAGAGYVKQKYVRADLAAQPSPVVKQNLTTQPAAAQGTVAVWTVTREGDPTFPRTYLSEAAADAMVAYVTLAPFAVKHAPVTAAPADLIERCKEILAWQRTGVLPGDALRAYANARWPDEHDPLQIAEKETAREAFRILARAAAASTLAAPGIDLTALADRITDHLCEHEYDIGGRDELLRHVREAIAAAMQTQAGDAEVQP